ncbi:ABC transporter ATP-binding protein [Halorussus salinisoli]|uniref:ABC transporter ATP-binding protein n=1 Tax=Halorussus salinisoli TaxID=2558242 RepID=UPI0010C1A87F|nr:ABC transporter ATP-binding protein [Halorussus salinisoli]
MPILEVRDVHAGYDQFLVLQGVDLEVTEGQIVCIIGPNGAGKSTLFKTLFGLLRPSQGSIEFRGESIVGLSQRELLDRGIAYILQRNAVFPDMTVEENLEMGAFTANDDFDVDAKFDEMYDIFPVLEEKRDHKASTLSGGQQQMVEFARGLMLDPDLLLLDEPTAGLAPKIIDDVFAKVRQINDLGVTVLMIEQNIKTGLQYADHAYVLENGQTKFDGPADTILDRPEIREAYLKEEID